MPTIAPSPQASGGPPRAAEDARPATLRFSSRWRPGQPRRARRGLHSAFVFRHASPAGAALLLLLSLMPALAQGSKADYERSANLNQRFANLVFKQRVSPHWLADTNRFWYRNDLSGGRREFVLVNAARGVRTPAFDHAKLAAALGKVAAPPPDAERLAVDDLDFSADGQMLTFRSGGKAWQCDLRTYALTAVEAAATNRTGLRALDRAPRASTRTGEETSITFLNRTGGEVEIFWLDAEGQRQRYATLAAGGQHDQHTFAGHVWLATDKATGRTLATFEANEAAAEAVDRKSVV